MKLRRVDNESLVDTVVEALRNYIARQGLSAGDRLSPEPILVEQLGVSRTVLREAVGRLQTIGLLDVQHGRGTFVASGAALASSAKLMRSALEISPKELMKYFEFRAVIESFAARRAAEIGTNEDFAELTKLCAQIDAEDQDYVDSVRTDFNFHYKLIEISGNELMMNVMKVLQEFILAGMVKTTAEPRDKEYSRKIHRELLRAILSRDPNIAGDAMDRHMKLSEHSLRTMSESVTASALGARGTKRHKQLK